MSYSSRITWILGSLAVLSQACASGEAVPADYGDEVVGAERPPAAQGDSTPEPNFAGCDGGNAANSSSVIACGNACQECIDSADEEDTDAILTCIYGSACQAYFAQYVEQIDDNGQSPDDNILLEPEPPEIEQGDPCAGATDACELCLCASENDQEACAPFCQ